MAGAHACRNRLPPADKDELVEDAPRAFIEGSGICTLTLAVSRASTPASAPAFTSAPGLPGKYTNENLQKATKLAPELFVKGQEHS